MVERRKVPNIRIQANIHPYTGSLSSLTLEHFGIWLAPSQSGIWDTLPDTHLTPHAESSFPPHNKAHSQEQSLPHPSPSSPQLPCVSSPCSDTSASCCPTSHSLEGFNTSPLFFALSNTPLMSQAVSQHLHMSRLPAYSPAGANATPTPPEAHQLGRLYAQPCHILDRIAPPCSCRSACAKGRSTERWQQDAVGGRGEQQHPSGSSTHLCCLKTRS